MLNDRQDIEATIRTYLDGFHHGDADRLATVFHSSCALTQSADGSLQIITRDAWLEMTRQRPSPAALELARSDEIVTVDVVGPHTAYVKLKCAIPPRYFTDLLSLLKVEGRWLIVQKVYQTASAP